MDRYHHGNLRAALLKAAFFLVRKSGPEGFTLREVARRAGVSHNAPYRHFRNKEDLIAALATDSFHQLHQALRAAVEPPGERLLAASRAYLAFALDNPARFHVMFHAAFDREAYPEYIAAYTQSLTLLEELLSGHANVETAAELIWSAVHGIAELGLTGRLRHGVRADLERLVDAAVAALSAGMRA